MPPCKPALDSMICILKTILPDFFVMKCFRIGKVSTLSRRRLRCCLFAVPVSYPLSYLSQSPDRRRTRRHAVTRPLRALARPSSTALCARSVAGFSPSIMFTRRNASSASSCSRLGICTPVCWLSFFVADAAVTRALCHKTICVALFIYRALLKF